jgi:hypothetical protein
MGHFEGFFKGVKKVEARSKNLKKCPIICFAPDKNNNFQDFQNQRYIGIFMSQERDRKRERERERERESKSKSKSKTESESRKGKEKGTGTGK